MLKVLLITLTLLCSLLQSSRSSAEVAFSVAPVRDEVSVVAGASAAGSLEILNEGDEPIRIQALIQDWTLTENGTPNFVGQELHEHSASSWVQVNPTDFMLKPGQSKIVRYQVDVPLGTAAKGCWTSLFFRTVPIVTPGSKASLVALKGNIAAVLYVKVGEPKPASDILNMATETSADTTQLTIQISNPSTMYFRTTGQSIITTADGLEVSKTPFPDAPILAKSSRTFAFEPEAKLAPGTYHWTVELSIPGEPELQAGSKTFQVK